MKKSLFLLLPFIMAACKNEKTGESAIFGNGNDDENNTEVQGRDANNGIQSIISGNLNEGAYYVDLTLPNIDGGTSKLSDFVSKNKVTLIDCWATWCGPCMEEMPTIAQINRKYSQLGVGVVGISFDTDRRAWETKVKINDMTWPQLSELKGWNNQMAEVYGIDAIPHTILINREGKILARGLRGEALINAIAKAL